MRDFLQPRQHDFLNLLPLLFHINHPLLPGFVSLDTPAGIPDYTPSKQTVDTAKQFSKGFVYKRKALRNYPIHSLFLMGSVGSMAFSKDSDMDIWLCHQPSLMQAELEELRQKADELERWAATLKLEVHFFLVNSEQFKRGENTPISAESSGETQHYLLLEEFYRTSIYIAGRVPVWWLVPPNQEKHYPQYVTHLLENRFISEVDVIDFGGLQDIPLTEFVGATLWHIYKSLTSPHKALLKLFLMESYAVEFPDPQWLCASMKRDIYQGDFSVDSLDPYLLIYRKVDSYLCQAGSRHRLNLARECFYIKIMGASSQALDSKARLLHENFMEMIAIRWRWPDNLLENLSSQKFWDIHKASAEHLVIRDQLQQCLRIILNITGTPGDREHNDLKLLSRKLRAFLDLRPGKVQVLTTRAMVHTKPDVLSIVEITQEQSASLWCLFSGKTPLMPVTAETAIKQSDNLLELLCWAVVNGLYKKGINLQITALSLKIAANDLTNLLSDLHGFLIKYLPIKETGLEVYSEPNRLLSSFLLVNWGEVLPIDANIEQFVMSERSDPLSYGESRQCFVQSIQKLSVSNWGEVTLQDYSDLEGCFSCLGEIFNQSMMPLSTASLHVVCHTRGRGRSIALRIKGIFRNLLDYFADSSQQVSHRYILPAAGGYGCFRFESNKLSFYFLENNDQLLRELADTRNQFSPVIFDDYVLEQTFIPFLYKHNLENTIQIFYHSTSKHVAVYVIDENGALFVRQHSGANPQHVLIHYSVFLRTLQMQAKLPVNLKIGCYEIQRNSQGVVSCHAVQVKPGEGVLDLRVRIVAEDAQLQAIYCNEIKFAITNTDSYRAVKNHILSFRKTHDDYPFHITEIDVPSSMLGVDYLQLAQSLHYLNYKQKIEEKLNI